MTLNEQKKITFSSPGELFTDRQINGLTVCEWEEDIKAVNKMTERKNN